MSTLPNPQSARLDFRLAQEHKSLIERAAHLRGQTVSHFALTTLLKAAEEAIQHATTRTLSIRDAETFLRMLGEEADPAEPLRRAADRYKAERGR